MTPNTATESHRRTLLIVISSIRPTRQGDKWAHWIAQVARENTSFNVEIADLQEIDLPLMREPHHPSQGNYQFEHTKAWAAIVDAADAILFVTGEYNYSIPAPLKNAIDYLGPEWANKPAGIVSYGGVSAGLRAAHHLRQILTGVDMFVPRIAVSIPYSAQYVSDEGKVNAPDSATASAMKLLAELERLTALLRPATNTSKDSH